MPQVLGNLIVLKVGMEDFNVSGKMRIAMRPLLDRTPIVGAFKVHVLGVGCQQLLLPKMLSDGAVVHRPVMLVV